MSLILLSGPAAEPISLEEAKDFLRVDHDEEDSLIGSLITTGRVHIEQITDRKLITQNWSWYLNQWPVSKEINLPLTPLQSVVMIRTYDEEGTSTLWDGENYTVNTYSEPGVLLRKSEPWPAIEIPFNGIEIQMVVGYGDSSADIPEPIRQALRFLVAQWYENREPVALGDDTTRIPDTVMAMLSPYQTVRF